MKSREDLNSTAIHEAAHVAACINLDLEFDAVYLEPSKDHPGLVAKLVKKADIDYSSGVLTPEEEVLSTNLVIVGFAGPAVDALHRGRASFDFSEYDDLDEVLDAIEYRFANNNVRIAFTHYCEAEAFALFEDDRRLWRFTHLLARELARQKKLTYAQCMELYSKEYLAESWVRKEVDEIRREGEAKGEEGEGRKEEERLAANYEQRAANIEKGPKEARGPKREGAPHQPKAGKEEKKHLEVPVQDREAPKHADVVQAAPEGGERPAEAEGQQPGERRGRRRRGRGRGRGRGRKREEAAEQLPPASVLEPLPGESIGGQPAEAPAGDKPQATNRDRNQQTPRPPQPVQGGKAAGQGNQPRPGVSAPAAQSDIKAPGQKEENTVPQPEQPVTVQGGEAPRQEEKAKIQLIKATKPPVAQEAPADVSEAVPPPAEAVVPPVAEPRPVASPPVVPPPVVPEVPAESPAAQPRRRPAVTGKKTEGTAVRGSKGTTNPDSIWEGEEKEAASDKSQDTGGRAEATGEGKKPAKAAKPRPSKAAKAARPAAEAPARPKAARTKAAPPTAEVPAAQKPPKAARPAKAARTPKAAAPEAPVKAARKAPAKKAAPQKSAEPKKPAARKSGGKKKE